MPALELDIKIGRAVNRLSFTVQIIEQRLRGGKASFMTSKGFIFSSLSSPAIGVYNRGGLTNGLLYLRGSSRRRDNDVLHTTSVGYIEKLKAAVIEYNTAKEDVV